MKWYMPFICVIICLGMHSCVCMDLFFSQKEKNIVHLPVADGIVHMPKWKVFESYFLRKHYLDNEKLATMPKVPTNITMREVELCNNVLDCEPGQKCVDYILSLSDADQQLLTNAAGIYSKQGNQTKLYIPSIIAHLVMAQLPQEVVDVVDNVRSYLKKEVSEIEHCFIKYMVNRNSFEWDGSTRRCYDDNMQLVECISNNGWIRKKPEGLDEDNTCFYLNRQLFYCDSYIGGRPWLTYCCKKMTNGREYRVTVQYKREGTIDTNTIILWMAEKGDFWQWKECKTCLISCVDRIAELFFSADGKYFMVRSDCEIMVMKLKQGEDESFCEKIIHERADGKSQTYYRNGDVLVTSFVIGGMSIVKLWNLTDQTSMELFSCDMSCLNSCEFNKDISQIFLCFEGKHEDIVTLWDVHDMSNVQKLPIQVSIHPTDKIHGIQYSEYDDSWVIVTQNNIIFLKKNNDVFDTHFYQIERCYSGDIRDMRSIIKNRLLFIAYPDNRWYRGGWNFLLDIYSVVTEQCIAKDISVQAQDVFGIPNNASQLICYRNSENFPSYTIQFINDENRACLKWITEKTSLFEVCMLMRLCKAKNVSEMNQGQISKALSMLPSDKKCNAQSLVKGCFGL